MSWINWVNALIGLWLIFAPWIVGYSNHAQPLWNDILAGLVVALLAGYLALQGGKEAGMSSGAMGHH